MQKTDTFEQFLSLHSSQIPLTVFTLDFCLTAILSWILSIAYVRYGTALSNRQMFARNFVMLATTTMLIISIVKSSLALSLGLVGALSIVRFRSAIKEPEELTFLFLCIALGLGFGAGQRLVTGLGFFLILIFIRMRVRSQIAHDNRDMSLIISSKSSEGLTLEQIHSVLQEFCVGVVLKRFDESNDALEAAYTVCFQNIESLQRCKTKFREMDQAISITFLDYSTT